MRRGHSHPSSSRTSTVSTSSVAMSSRSSSTVPSSHSTPGSLSTTSSAGIDDVIVVADDTTSPAASTLSYGYVDVHALRPVPGHGLPATLTSQPTKKIKTAGSVGSASGGLMARFLAAGAYIGRQHHRS
jgi:hypothetical protein